MRWVQRELGWRSTAETHVILYLLGVFKVIRALQFSIIAPDMFCIPKKYLLSQIVFKYSSKT